MSGLIDLKAIHQYYDNSFDDIVEELCDTGYEFEEAAVMVAALIEHWKKSATEACNAH